jgi:hypothetical protein
MDEQQALEMIARFKRDPDFKRRAMMDLNGAVEQDFGVKLPQRLKLVEENGQYRLETLQSANGDLSDEELEIVSGGKPSSAPPTRAPTPGQFMPRPSAGFINRGSFG